MMRKKKYWQLFSDQGKITKKEICMLREKAAESARLKLEDTWYDVDQYKQKHPGFKVNYFTNHENQKGVTI